MEETLGKRIVTNRKRIGMTQDQLAEKLGITAQAVSKWENDQSCPDITMLPKLAEIFGTTTDALLGITAAESVHEATVVMEDESKDGFQFRNGNWEFKYDNSRRGGIFLAALVLLIGGLYLVSSLFQWDVGLWDIIWPSALLVFGIHGVYPKFSFLSLGCIIFGGFFLVNNFVPVKAQLDNGVIIATIIILIGGGLLMDALRKPRKPKFAFTYNGKHPDGTPNNSFHIQDNGFVFDACFGDLEQQVCMPLMKKGMINTSFGDYEVDLSGVEDVTTDCRIEANASFGDLTIFVPSRYQVRCASSASFADVEIEGKPDPVPAGTIQLIANVSFGQITVEYI